MKIKPYVTFRSYREACCFVALYAGTPTGSKAYKALLKEVEMPRGDFDKLSSEECRAAMEEAVRQIIKFNRISVSDL